MVHRRIQHFEILQYPYATFIDGDPLAENTGLRSPDPRCISLYDNITKLLWYA